MKCKQMALSACVAGVALSLGHADEDSALRLQLYNVVPGKGQLLVAVCLQKEFLTPDCTVRLAVPATANPQIVNVPQAALPPGRYAVQVIYDRNANNKLDANLLGIPQEPVGFSRDAQGRMGPPKFEQAAFEFERTALTFSIHLY
jgi:uncharacterized protein (DUF2141 family)